MYYDNNKLIYSPSDIVQFVNSQFACWMNRKLFEEPESVQPDEDDPQLKILQDKGDLHEKAYLEKLLEAGNDICKITSGDKLQQTLKVLLLHIFFENSPSFFLGPCILQIALPSVG